MEMEGGVPETLLYDIISVFESWLERISILEDQQKRVENLEERVGVVLSQIRGDGFLQINEFEELQCIGKLWLDLIKGVTLLPILGDLESKKKVVNNILKLLELGHISRDFAVEIIIHIYESCFLFSKV